MLDEAGEAVGVVGREGDRGERAEGAAGDARKDEARLRLGAADDVLYPICAGRRRSYDC